MSTVSENPHGFLRTAFGRRRSRRGLLGWLGGGGLAAGFTTGCAFSSGFPFSLVICFFAVAEAGEDAIGLALLARPFITLVTGMVDEGCNDRRRNDAMQDKRNPNRSDA